MSSEKRFFASATFMHLSFMVSILKETDSHNDYYNYYDLFVKQLVLTCQIWIIQRVASGGETQSQVVVFNWF